MEDDSVLRTALAQQITAQGDLCLVLHAACRREALERLPQRPLDVLLIDLGLPDGTGLDVIRAARACWPQCGVLVSTVFGDEAHVLRAVAAGAVGYLLKGSSAPEIAGEIRSVHAGGSPISPMVARTILAQARAHPTAVELAAPAAPDTAGSPAQVTLSTREHEVLQLVSKGFTAEEAAELMGVSVSTVRTFVRRIYAKLDVDTRAEAVYQAHCQGLLDA